MTDLKETPVPSTMRATVLIGHGGLDRLVYRDDVTTPSPGEREVLVRVGACGMNNTDINTRTGWYDTAVKTSLSEDLGLHGRDDDPASSWNQSSVTFPRIQGAAVVGSIIATGPEVDPTRVGQRVMVDPAVRDASLPKHAQISQYLGSERDGGFAEFVAVPDENAHVVDSHMSDAELATFPCSYDTAEEMLERAHLESGETIVITGAAGGVGTALIQLSLVRGARVVAIASPSKRERLLKLGAHEFVPRDVPDLQAAVEEKIGPRGAHVAADVVGGDMFDVLLKVLARAGRYATAGAIGGPETTIDLRDLIYKDLEMYGITNPTPETFARLVSLVQAGKLRPLLDASYPLAELAQAQAAMLKRTHVGKYVVTP
ncbi:alcohol dehydrogenase family protein [Nocardioides astragali]|uniref:Alcohol dehydrogenase family protein n=1 Tax=Nocardioides astragali TaxID=1776736 RepID=A0ABW2N7H7_9ACTN|nr:alcohol dehydrogenase family protein [Nocardioides astragali]